MSKQNPFEIDPNLPKKLELTSFKFSNISQGKRIQELVGFSDEEMDTFYVAAGDLYNEHKYADAVDAFLFLATLSPNHGEYWIGLGMSLQRCEHHEEAVSAYELAAICNLDDPVSYFHLSKCLFAMHERDNALQAIELAIELSEDREEYDELHHQALVARTIILQEMN